MTDENTTGARMTDASEVITAIIEVNLDVLGRIDVPHTWKGAEVPQLDQYVDTNGLMRTKTRKGIINGWPRIKDATDHGRRMKAPI